ncbi:helix-turn-helix transcriptional regulator [Paenalcaligenes suwonensis]|uniref:helix-turn-helix transcriptional regulator n=1 Tax=Paenalcaligenes suwonensis TaxID=1202713 RepID=UPI00140B9FB9|nr:response regulator transcription factor [Paenalcaligenes suwonensis]NHC63253.1 response regulator transcription factor [Paenalcaligenes suwonensis]
MQQVVSVLMLSNDDYLWQHWRALPASHWMLARGHNLEDLQRWKQSGRQLVVIDHALKLWQDSQWADVSAGMQCVVASTSPNDVEGQQVLAAGARGYIHAYAPVATLERVLEHVQAGEVWVGQSLLSRLLSTISQKLPENTNPVWHHGLTAREIDVAQRAALGHSNQLIADDLGISERTVRAHMSAVFEKLHVTDRLMLSLKVHGIR